MANIQIIAQVVYLGLGALFYWLFKIEPHEINVPDWQHKEAIALIGMGLAWPWLLPWVLWQRRRHEP